MFYKNNYDSLWRDFKIEENNMKTFKSQIESEEQKKSVKACVI